MRVIIQRVQKASVSIAGKVKAVIGQGLLILLGVEGADTQEDITWLCQKIMKLRIFSDEAGKMNQSVLDIEGELLVVSQFTLFASTKKGNRPSYLKSAKPEVAIPLYEAFVKELETVAQRPIKTGEFGADMQVELLNDGPVTIWIDTKNKE
ncbi:MAG: D-aminoacyl-tRNA deacylase [Bacteroidota bacterium]